MQWLLRIWVPLAIGVTCVCGLIYLSIQQSERQSLNDPQIQIAEDAAAILKNGGSAVDVVPSSTTIDAAASLAPWIAVYDATGTPLQSDAVLSGEAPRPPQGSFDAARAKGTNLPHNTWESADGTRTALVLVWVPEKQVFVGAGRNMREVENREWNLEFLLAVGWIVTLALTLVAAWVGALVTAQPGDAW